MESSQEVEWISFCEGLTGWVKEDGEGSGWYLGSDYSHLEYFPGKAVCRVCGSRTEACFGPSCSTQANILQKQTRARQKPGVAQASVSKPVGAPRGTRCTAARGEDPQVFTTQRFSQT